MISLWCQELSSEPLAKLEEIELFKKEVKYRKQTQHTEITEFRSILYYCSFADGRNNQKKQYDAQRKDSMADGKTITNFIHIPKEY